MAQTAFADALKKAGVNTDAALLHNLAVDILRKNDKLVSRSIAAFAREVRSDAGLMAELAAVYLDQVAADMLGPKSSGGVLSERGANSVHTTDVPSGSVSPQGDGSVHSSRDGQTRSGAPDESEGDGAHPEVGASSVQSCYSPSPSPNNRNGAVLSRLDRQSTSGRVVPIPNKPRGIEALRAVQRHAGPSLFDTLLIRSRPVGDIVFGELNGIITTSKREAALLTLIRDHAQVHPATTKVRDIIKISDLQRMAQKAAEMSDA